MSQDLGDPFLQGLIVYNKVIAQGKVLSPSRPFRSAKMTLTVCTVPWAAKPTGCPARPGGEQSRRIDCRFHRRCLR